jgi:hypothetical protein
MQCTSGKAATKTRRVAVALAAVGAALINVAPAHADDAQAKNLFKAMSDYLAAQNVISLDYDSTLDVVTDDGQKLGLASSGTVTLNRPDKLHAKRKGGFADVELVFDGKTVTLLSKDPYLYVQVAGPGTIDQLVDELRDKYHRPVPGADLLMSNVYDQLMPMVVDAKDLGSGVIGGVECDHLAFRAEDVDWQIWIAQGEHPYPCRYVITSTKVSGAPQYILDIRNWKTGTQVASDGFRAEIPSQAKKMDSADAPEFDDIPAIFSHK